MLKGSLGPYNAIVKIGSYILENDLILAPMAGVTDRPFRQLCKRLGAGMAVSEMTSCDPGLRNTRKSRQRLNHQGESGLRSVQIAGADPLAMADAARFNVEHGAQIIDINMGCPAKKVCNVMAGSALMQDELLVGRILAQVVRAVDVPVTLKIRTGWNRQNRNGLRIARIAEQSGIQALAVHGRTRDDLYRGAAEYRTIRRIKQSISIPVIANGDIDSAEKAREVLASTGADGLMIGRAAQGNPWIFREISSFLQTGQLLPEPTLSERQDILSGHLHALYEFYGEYLGVRFARKHLGWYLQKVTGEDSFRQTFVRLESSQEQQWAIQDYFGKLEYTARAA